MAFDTDPPLPPMAPMAPMAPTAPAAAWSVGTDRPSARVGTAPGESSQSTGSFADARFSRLEPSAVGSGFDPLGSTSWLGAGVGFARLLRPSDPPLERVPADAPGTPFASTRGLPVTGASRSMESRSFLTAGHGLCRGLSRGTPPSAPPPPPGAPPPLPRGPPPASARVVSRRSAPPGPSPPPLPPTPHPAQTGRSAGWRGDLRGDPISVGSAANADAFGGGIFGGFASGGVAASPPRHERFDSDEFRAEGRELEDELMALTGGLMHLDYDDDDDAVGGDSATRDGTSDGEPPKPDDFGFDSPDARVASGGDAGGGANVFGPSSVCSGSPGTTPSAFPRVSEMMTSAVSTIRAAAGSGVKIPAEFFCSITHDVMVDPVIAWDGYTYERVSVARWLDKHSTSPMTGAPMPDFTLRPNHSMRSQMISFGEQL
jgi:hypothetical protein